MKDIKIGYISDTHGRHNTWRTRFDLFSNRIGMDLEKEWEELDLLIFCGDCSGRGYEWEIVDFMDWFSDQPAKEKVMISGNHDFFFDIEFRSKNPRSSREESPEEQLSRILRNYPDIHYLNDSSIELYGLKIWGSPITPWFHNWAFNRYRSQGKDYVAGGIKQHWNKIPNDTDILVVHGPPRGKGDLIVNKFRRSGENPNVGCDDLMDAIKRVQPKIVCFGHIHEGYGVIEEDNITYINASCLNEDYEPVNIPIIQTFNI